MPNNALFGVRYLLDDANALESLLLPTALRVGRIVVVPERCGYCRICELVCAYVHFGVVNPRKAAIRVLSTFPNPPVNRPIVCMQCGKPPCMDACPADAIYRDEHGIVRVDPNKCIKCGNCAEACPFGAIFFHADVHHAIKCDLCGGDPQCVRYCPNQALRYLPPHELGQPQRVKLASATWKP